jgi:metal-responsive CopG/Arc/MetJ family transcriptional regulator
MSKVRLSIEVNEDLAKLLDDIAETEAVPRTEIVRRALAVIKTYKEQIAVGRTHIGFAKDSDKLDLEIVGVLTTPVQSDTAKTTKAKAA